MIQKEKNKPGTLRVRNDTRVHYKSDALVQFWHSVTQRSVTCSPNRTSDSSLPASIARLKRLIDQKFVPLIKLILMTVEFAFISY